VYGDDEMAAQSLTKMGREFENDRTDIHKGKRKGDWAHQGRM
jgi:hypothetical protein